MSLLETVTARRGGVSEPVPSIDATVVSWLKGDRVCVGWFEGDSAVILSLSIGVSGVFWTWEEFLPATG